jgi:hypothetical protein
VRIKPPPPDEVDIDDVQIWDLVAAFNKIMSSIGVRAATHDVVFDDTPISLHALDIVDRLQNHNGVLAFEEVFKGRTKSEMIGLFLALLELMRQQRVRITQSEAFAPIQVTLLSAEPIEIGDEYEPGLRSAVGDESKQVHDEPGEGDARTTSQSGAVGGWPHEDEDEAESFAELDGIKTDVDMDSILREGRGRDEEPEAGA